MEQTENVHQLPSLPMEVICVREWVPREALTDRMEKTCLTIEDICIFLLFQTQRR